MKGMGALIMSAVLLLGMVAPVVAGGRAGARSGQSSHSLRSGFEHAAGLARSPERPGRVGSRQPSVHGVRERRAHGFRHDHRDFKPHHRFRHRTFAGTTLLFGSPSWVAQGWWPAGHLAPPPVVYHTPPVYGRR